jgi:hypothetical protein
MGMRCGLTVGWALAVGLTSLLAACFGSQGQPPSSLDTETAERLRGERFRDIMAVALPSLRLEDGEERLTVAGASDWSVDLLARLIGQLDEEPSLEMATFFVLKGPEGQRLPGLNLPSGVFVAFVAVDRQGRLGAGGVAMLEEGRERIVPLEAAEGLASFRPGAVQEEVRLSVRPALVTDVDGDGRHEMALAWRQDRQTLAWETHYVYRLQPGGEGWQRIGRGEGEPPVLTILDYWDDLAAATAIAGSWALEARLEVIWPWLVRDMSPPTSEMLLELVPSGESKEVAEAREALDLLRDFFRGAHASLSPSLQKRQPWAALVNGFRHTEGVVVEGVSPPVLNGTDRAKVEVFLTLASHEGQDVRWRQFLVTVEMEMLAGHWYLDDIDAEERRSPTLDSGP